jgi:hypothetical protein
LRSAPAGRRGHSRHREHTSNNRLESRNVTRSRARHMRRATTGQAR